MVTRFGISDARPVSAVAALVIAGACGGTTVIEPSGSGGAGSGGTAADGGAGSPCVLDGFRACAIDHECSVEGCGDDWCMSHHPEFLEKGSVSLCANDRWYDFSEGRYCEEAREDELCAHLFMDKVHAVFAVPRTVAVLLAQVGGGDQVHYTDLSRFSLADGPPAEPADCPTAGLSRCGPASCQPCPADTTCRGRSPRHPYGLCLPTDPRWCTVSTPTTCDDSERCLIWEVEPALQHVADLFGTCVEISQCEATAADLPGGAYCY